MNMDTSFPAVGTLWVWRGNDYNVLSVSPLINTILLSENGSGLTFWQSRVGLKWREPCRHPGRP
jgi:hypothetical protein